MLKLDPRVLRHAVTVSVRMALFRLVFGLVKQLLMKGGLFRGTARILSGIETEIVSYNPVKWALFGGTMSLFRPVQQTIEQVLDAITRRGGRRQHQPDSNGAAPAAAESSASWSRMLSSFLAGALVSLPTLKVFNVTTRVELTLYVVVRALYSILTEVAAPMLIPSSVRSRIPPQLFNMVSMAAAGTSLLGCVTFCPETHSVDYRNFLVAATTLAPVQTTTMSELTFGGQLSPLSATFAAQHGLFDVLAAAKAGGSLPLSTNCRFVHPNTKSCNVAFLQQCLANMQKVSLPLYVPLKFITTLMRGPAKIAKDPLGALKNFTKQTLMSSMFLTLYVWGSYRTMCLGAQLNVNPMITTVMAGVLSGISLQLEPLERQTDLVLFCAMHGLRSAYLLLNTLGRIPRPTRNTVAVAHTLAWATMFTVNEVRPETLRGLFAATVKFFVGKTDEERQQQKRKKAIALSTDIRGN